MRCTITLVTLAALVCALHFAAAQPLVSYDSPFINGVSSPSTFTWIVPANTYRVKITAVGASGGNHYSNAGDNSLVGAGTSVTGVFFVNPRDVFTIVVGERGGDGTNSYWGGNRGGGGGGGGSFIFKVGNTIDLYVAAGGGGGGTHRNWASQTEWAEGRDAITSTNGQSSWDGAPGGINGASAGGDGAGKGWNDITPATTGASYFGGAKTQYGGKGGYGGGGAGQDTNANPGAAGGGGGYSGGAPGTFNAGGGAGGGSYVSAAGASATFATSNLYGHGKVIIETSATCGANSDFDVANVTCLCRSGWSGLGCTSQQDGCNGFQPALNVTYDFPVIETEGELKPVVENDNLNLWISGPYVVDRRYVTLNFEGAAIDSSCNFAGKSSYWVKTSSDSGCKDHLKLVLPWKNAQSSCKFSKTTAGDLDVYSNKLNLVFTEDMGVRFGVQLTRTSRHTYNVAVSFPNSITITLNDTQISADIQLDSVLTNEMYDPATKVMTLLFTTVTPWSGKLGNLMMVFPPSTIQNVGDVVQGNSDLSCPLDRSGTACAQTWSMSFKIANMNDTTCSFDGLYSMNSTIWACRAASKCSNATVDISFQLKTGSVCASVSVKPTITAEMNAYTSAVFSADNKKTSFKLGDRAYFQVRPTAAGNSLNMTFTDISYTSELGSATLLSNGNILASGTNVDIKVYNKDKYFSVYFSGTEFPIEFGTKKAINFVAKAKLIWAGASSKKRNVEEVEEIEMFYEFTQFEMQDGMNLDMGVEIGLSGPSNTPVIDNTAVIGNTKPEIVTVNGPINLASVIGIAVGGVVVGVVMVLGVVFVAYKKMTNAFVQVPTSEPHA